MSINDSSYNIVVTYIGPIPTRYTVTAYIRPLTGYIHLCIVTVDVQISQLKYNECNLFIPTEQKFRQIRMLSHGNKRYEVTSLRQNIACRPIAQCFLVQSIVGPS